MTAAPVRKILVVTDLGAAGAIAVQVGATQARAIGASLALVHAMPSLEMVRPVFTQHVADDALFRAALPQRLGHALDQQLAAQAPEGPPAEVFLETGGTAERALEVADRWGADLIVVGAPQDGAVESERIVRHAHVPVLVARAGPAGGPVIACTDLSDPSLPAVRAAAEEAKRSGDDLYAIHALELMPIGGPSIDGFGLAFGAAWIPERRADASRRLLDAVRAFDPCGRAVVVDGPVVPALVAAARERGARLLVIGTVGRTGLTRFLLGSVAESLVRAAPCSTLVVRLRRGESAPGP